MMGGVLRNTSGTVQSVDSLQFVLSLGSLKSIASALFATRSPSDDQVREAQRVAEDWEQRLIDAVLSMEGSGRYGFRLHVFAKRTETDLLVDANSANFPLIVAGDLCVVLFTAIILARTDPLKSRALAAFVSVLLVCIGAISSLGLSALLGISFTALHLQVLPFLALGLGIDQFYLIALNFRTATNSHIQNSGLAMKESGASIALSTAMNLVAFGIAASMPLPAITLFASSACVAVAINFLISLVGFTAVLSLDSRRTLSGRADCIPCVKVNTTKLMPPACVQELGSDGTPVDQGVPTEAAGSGLSSKIGRIYGGCIIRPVSKAVILSGAAALICIASYGVTQLEVGLPLADIVPADHFAATFLKVREESYTDFEASIITGMGPDGVPVPLDYARALPQLRQAQSELQRVPRVNARVPIAAVSWVDNFILYVAQNSPGNLTSDGYPAPAFFYPLLRQWLVTARGVSFASRLRFNDDGTLRTTSIRFFMTGISTAEDMVRVIEDTRSVLDRQPLPLFPEGFVFNFYEQYLNVGPTLVRNLVWVVLGVAPVSFLVLLHPGAALIMLAHIGMIVLLLVGFMPFFGLLLNGVSIVNTIMAVGVSVEYVSHMVRAFMVAPGTRETRVILSLGSILLPNLAGAVATALGVLPIAFARYPYFKLYFFAMYTMIAVASAVVGLVVLPAVLALVGPLSGGSVTKDRRASLKWTTSHSEMTGVAKKESVAVVPVGN
jgi:Niemann-Pick C1 protein